MTDPRIAALAEALQTIPVPASYEEWQSRVDVSYEADAAAILAALPPDWCGHSAFDGIQDAMTITNQTAEIARLRKIEEAARAIETWTVDLEDPDPEYRLHRVGWEDALRAALDADASPTDAGLRRAADAVGEALG